ncbi:uncharacterized protein [Asterias amurensis]|uniref:uncharacterized protein n=1 Tax=Asterias amurensis TaxID=7602 RepID=UPI003AB337C5
MESKLIHNYQDDQDDEDTPDILPEDAEWSLAKQCLSVFLIEVYQCRFCSSFNSTQKVTVTGHLKEKHLAEWQILTDVNNVSLVDKGSQSNPVNQEDLEEMVERELTDDQLRIPDQSPNQRVAILVQHSSVERSSDSHIDGTETFDRICETNVTKSPEQSAEAGEKSINTPENGKGKQEVGKRKKKPGRPKKERQLSPEGDGQTSQLKRDVGHELTESACLKDLTDLSRERPTRPGLRGNRKPKVFKDYVVSRLSKRKNEDVKQGEEETSDYEHADPEDVEPEAPETEDVEPKDVEPKLQFQCDKCDFHTSREYSLQIHLRNVHHFAMKKPKCPLCFRRFGSHRGLKRHRQFNNCRPQTKRTDMTDITGGEKLKCDQCDYQSPSLIGLKIHNRIHGQRQERRFPCDLCSKTFTSLKGVQSHQRFRCSHLHNRKKSPTRAHTFQCTDCKIVCKNRKVLLEHMSTHSLIRSHKCHKCSKTYKTSTSLYRHVQKHKSIFLACTQCNFKTQWKSSLKNHVNTKHNGKESLEYFKCSQCEFKTKSKFYIKRHENTHSDDRPFICEICGKSLKTETVLKIHMETHQDHKYPCAECDFVAKSRVSLYGHRLVHTSREQMRYKCDQCDWAGKRKNELKMHYRKHFTAKLYQCGHCGKSYKHNHGLTRHLKEKHFLYSRRLSAPEGGLASEDEPIDIHVLNSIQVEDTCITPSKQISIQINSEHLRETQLLQEAQEDHHQALLQDQESLQAQAGIMNSIHVTHIIQTSQEEMAQVQDDSDFSHSTGDDDSRVVSQIVKQYQIIHDSQDIDHPEDNLNQDECTLEDHVIQQSNVAMTSVPVAQFYEITTTDVTGDMSHDQNQLSC